MKIDLIYHLVHIFSYDNVSGNCRIWVTSNHASYFGHSSPKFLGVHDEFPKDS